MNAPATIAETFQLSFPEPDIALLTLDMPEKGANVLSSSVLDELARHLDELEKRTDIRGLIFISAKPNIFIAGADLARVRGIAADHYRRTNVRDVPAGAEALRSAQ